MRNVSGKAASVPQGQAGRFEQPLQELTANLLRVMSGAGKPQLIAEQAAVVAQTLSEFGDRATPSIAKVLSDIPKPVFDLTSRGEYGDSEADWRRARWLVTQGTLQILAAEMLGQQTQAKIGHKRLAAGLRALEELRDRQRDRLNEDDDVPGRRLSRNGAESVTPVPLDAIVPPEARARSSDGASRQGPREESPGE